MLRNEVRDYYDEINRRQKREASLLEQLERKVEMLITIDEYPSEKAYFNVFGHDITITDELIAESIATLTEEKRYIILLAYFLDMTDGEIGNKLNRMRRTVQYNRISSLQKSRKFMEGKNNG